MTSSESVSMIIDISFTNCDQRHVMFHNMKVTLREIRVAGDAQISCSFCREICM